MKNTFHDIDITIDFNDIDYEATPYHPATFNDPAEGGIEDVMAVWKEFPDKNGNKVRVNIVELFDEVELIEFIQEGIKDGLNG